MPGSIISGLFANDAANTQANAATQAANTSADATRYSTDVQKQIYDQTRADQQPWRTTGANALSQLASGTQAGGSLIKPFSMADYQEDPGYQFRLQQGMRGLQNSYAARGGLLSGNALKGITNYNQGAASQEYGAAYDRYNNNQKNQYNRLASLAGVGQQANDALQSAGQSYGGNVGNLAMQNAANSGMAGMVGANARASSYTGVGNALSKALGNYNGNNWFGSSSGGSNNSDPNSYYFGGGEA